MRIREIDAYKDFVANNPRIMTWGNKSDVTRTELRLESIIHFDHYPTGNHVDEVRNLTTLCPHGRLNAFRPAPTRLTCPIAANAMDWETSVDVASCLHRAGFEKDGRRTLALVHDHKIKAEIRITKNSRALKL